jgi:hypothetical protein
VSARKNNSRTDGEEFARLELNPQQINSIYVELMSLLGWFSNERKKERELLVQANKIITRQTLSALVVCDATAESDRRSPFFPVCV